MLCILLLNLFLFQTSYCTCERQSYDTPGGAPRYQLCRLAYWTSWKHIEKSREGGQLDWKSISFYPHFQNDIAPFFCRFLVFVRYIWTLRIHFFFTLNTLRPRLLRALAYKTKIPPSLQWEIFKSSVFTDYFQKNMSNIFPNANRYIEYFDLWFNNVCWIDWYKKKTNKSGVYKSKFEVWKVEKNT